MVKRTRRRRKDLVARRRGGSVAGVTRYFYCGTFTRSKKKMQREFPARKVRKPKKLAAAADKYCKIRI